MLLSQICSIILAVFSPDVGAGPIVLLIIKPTKDGSELQPTPIISDPRVKAACFFLTDIDITRLHDCHINNNSFETVTLKSMY